MHKVWHRPLHQRKIWKRMSLYSKLIYYMEPFVHHLLETWMQPLPFPTIMKVFYSVVLVLIILVPILYPSAILLSIYAEMQYVLESQLNVCFPKYMDLLGYLKRVLTFEFTNEKYALFVALYIERWRILCTAIASSIDYMRLALMLLFGRAGHVMRQSLNFDFTEETVVIGRIKRKTY